MIDYSAYEKIVSYLDGNNIDELRKYLEKEKTKFYLQEARKKLTTYLKYSQNSFTTFCGYMDDGKIVLFNAISAYILNSDEILTPNRKQDLKLQNPNYTRENIQIVENAFNKFENCGALPVGKIEPNNLWTGQSFVSSDDETISQKFETQNFNYAQFFLGENTQYAVCKNIPACLANSEKGKGLILGIK